MHVLQMVELEQVPAQLQLRICHKSGKLLGKYRPEEIANAITIHGVSRTTNMLAMRYNSHCGVEWLQTDPEALDNLMEHDPLGYYVFALSKVCGFFKGDTAEIFAKYTLRVKLETAPLPAIVEINKRFREILALTSPRDLQLLRPAHVDLAAATPDNVRSWSADLRAKVTRLHDSSTKVANQHLVKHANFAAQKYLNRGVTTEELLFGSINLNKSDIFDMNVSLRKAEMNAPKQKFTGVTLAKFKAAVGVNK